MDSKILITRQFLEDSYRDNFSKEEFLSVDPCGLVYELKEHTENQLDLELGALFVAMITWGNRKAIRQAGRRMLRDEMKWQPAEFILKQHYLHSYETATRGCVYRTLNRDRFIEVCDIIHDELVSSGLGPEELCLERLFLGHTVEEVIDKLCRWLAPARLGKAGVSACKRICMYLRWMIRQGEPDLGLWARSKDKRNLYAIMDVHVCQLTASLLGRKQANWKSCVELTEIFRSWNPADPLFYDVALMTVADHVDTIR